LLDWLEKKRLKFRGTLIVPPVAYPNEIPLLFVTLSGKEDAMICSFVKNPNSPAPASSPVNLCDRFAERKNTVVALQIVFRHAVRVGDTAMVRVVEQELKARVPASILSDLADQIVLVPLVDDYQISSVESFSKAVLAAP
jgi:hypothetical protein